jgi:hypothetical protein
VEQLKEQLKYETELLRLSWVTAIAIEGGNASLIVGDITLVRAILLVIGFLLISTLSMRHSTMSDRGRQ